jgi:hypothetical protein
MSEDQINYPEPTPEQLATYEKKRAELLEHWNKEIPKLEIELQYNTLLEKIETSRVNTWVARMRLAEIMAPAPEESKTQTSAK